MASEAVSVDFTLRLEDATLSGVVSDLPNDPGGKTRFGIASTFHPELLATTFYTTMSTPDALQVAMNILSAQYAAPLQLAEWPNQTLANIVTAFAVNAGVEAAVRTLQAALNSAAGGIVGLLARDGFMGPQTLSVMRAIHPVPEILAFRVAMVRHYEEHEPDNLLRGLIRRALA